MVAAIDYLGFVDELTPLVKRLTGSKVGKIGKPFNCSTCATWWLSVLYIIITGHFTLPYLAACMVAALLTPFTLDLIHLVKDTAYSLITWIYKILGI